MLVGCGRLGFDPLVNGGGDDTSGDDTPGADAARTDDAAGIACPSVPMCPTQTIQLTMGMNNYGTSVMTDHGLASKICGSGNANPEVAVMYVPQVAGTYRVSVSPAAATMYVQDGCCGGPELMCGGGALMVPRKAGETFVVVVEGTTGMFFTVTVQPN